MASQPPFSSPVRVRLEFLDGSSTPQVVSAAQPLPVTGGGGGGGGGGGAVTAAAGSYVAGAIVDLGTGATPAANTVNANLVALKAPIGATGATAPTSAILAAGTDYNSLLRSVGVAIFHNADNQALGSSQYGLITGGITQILNSAGNLDRVREGYADAMPVTGLQGSIGMLWNGTTLDRNRSAYSDALAITGVQAAADMLWNGASFDRPRSAYADGIATTGVAAETDMLWNGTTFDRPRSVTGDGMAQTGIAAEVDLLWNGTTYDRLRSAVAAQATIGTGIEASSNFAQYNTTAPTLTNGQFSVSQCDTNGNTYVNLKTALPAGTNTIGNVNQSAATAGFAKVTDGTNVAAVKAASTAAVAADPSIVVAVSPNSPVPAVGNRPWSAQVTITRPANTTAYAAGQLLASATTGLTALPTVALGVGANQQVIIQNVAIISSNGAVATKGQFSAYLFNTPSPAGAGFNDASTFAPTAAALATAGNALIGTVASSLPNTGTAAYGYSISNLTIQATTDASGNLYLGPVLNNAYPPASGETVTFLFSGVR